MTTYRRVAVRPWSSTTGVLSPASEPVSDTDSDTSSRSIHRSLTVVFYHQGMDVSENNFQAAVIERSHTLPVVVDFWAEWCGPCRQLGPALERAAAARAGKLELVKVDVDANQELSRTYRIQGIPAVKAFKDGEVAAEFVGAQPPAAVERFMDSLVPSEADALVAQGDEASLREAVALAPTRADAAVPLARLLYGRGEIDEALQVLGCVPGSFAGDGLVARIGLERAAADGSRPGLPDLSAAFSAIDAGDDERALDLLLQALPGSDGARDDIRRVVVGILDELGVENPLARDARRRLAAALY
jgi:putative thioredoxin